MATATTHITNPAWSPFYYLKITGLPYYFFATIDPTSSTYGSDAWTLPTGFTAVRGMDIPNDTLSQGLRDIVGGIATPERVRLTFKDFDKTDTIVANTYKFLGRLWAMNRVLNSGTVKVAMLNSDFAASTTSGTFTARGGDTFVTTAADVFLMNETIGVSATSRVAATGITTFTISARNKYPCMTSYPPTPYYRVPKDEFNDALTSASAAVASEPITLVGRTAALYIGAMMPSGAPETEASSVARLVGRIQSLTYEGGLFTMEIESVLADLEGALVGGDLAQAEINGDDDVICLPDETWGSLVVGMHSIDHDGTLAPKEKRITITGYGTSMTIENVIDKVRKAIASISGTTKQDKVLRSIRLNVVQGANGMKRAIFYVERNGSNASINFRNYSIYVAHSNMFSSSLRPIRDSGSAFKSLLCALGFPVTPKKFEASDTIAADIDFDDPYNDDIPKHTLYVVAPDPLPGVFIPFATTATNTFPIAGKDNPARRFFTAQDDAGSPAFVRFGKQTGFVRITAISEANQTITTADRASFSEEGLRAASYFYAVPLGQTGTVEQVLVDGDRFGKTAASQIRPLARMLCSTWQWFSTPSGTDAEFQVYPEGVGLGLNAIVDKDTVRGVMLTEAPRTWIVDRNTTFKDVWDPIARENHLFLVWDPSAGKIAIRKLVMPAASIADTTYTFSESNRPREGDVTQATWDNTHVRTGWKVSADWLPDLETYHRTVSYSDQWARVAYGLPQKTEEIKDPTLWYGAPLGPILSGISASAVYYRYPWLRCRRSVNKTGLVLAPGTVHKVIDATIHNPFTGTFGIVSGDNVYAILTKVDARLGEDNEVDVEYLITSLLDARPWSPCALIDSDFGGDPSDDGYNPATKTLTLRRFYTNNSDASTYDGIDFVAGDTVLIATRDNDGAPGYTYSDTVVSVSADGRSMVLTTGIPGGSLSLTVESFVTLQKYTSATTARQSNVAWQGDAATQLIQSTARLNKWQ